MADRLPRICPPRLATHRDDVFTRTFDRSLIPTAESTVLHFV